MGRVGVQDDDRQVGRATENAPDKERDMTSTTPSGCAREPSGDCSLSARVSRDRGYSSWGGMTAWRSIFEPRSGGPKKIVNDVEGTGSWQSIGGPTSVQGVLDETWFQKGQNGRGHSLPRPRLETAIFQTGFNARRTGGGAQRVGGRAWLLHGGMPRA